MKTLNDVRVDISVVLALAREFMLLLLGNQQVCKSSCKRCRADAAAGSKTLLQPQEPAPAPCCRAAGFGLLRPRQSMVGQCCAVLPKEKENWGVSHSRSLSTLAN